MAWVAGAAALISLIGVAGQTMAANKSANANAQALERQAQNTEENAAYQEQQYRRSARFASGQARAATAASGISLTSGSPLLMELDRVQQSELEAQIIRRGGQLESSSQRFGADLYRATKFGNYLRGASQGASILSTYVGPRYGTSTYTV